MIGDIALEEDQAPGLHLLEEGAFLATQRRAGAAEDQGLNGHRGKPAGNGAGLWAEHGPFGKPAFTFPDHAVSGPRGLTCSPSGNRPGPVPNDLSACHTSRRCSTRSAQPPVRMHCAPPALIWVQILSAASRDKGPTCTR